MTPCPMTACPRYEACSAPLCPLNRDRSVRSHLRGEPVCGFLRELVKAGGPARVKTAVPEDLFELIGAAAVELTAPRSPIYWQLRVAAGKKSRRESGQVLRLTRRTSGNKSMSLQVEHASPPVVAGRKEQEHEI
jgi:hypothetical protein